MESEHLVSEYLGHFFGTEHGVCWNHMHLFGELVHYGADGVESF